MNTNKRGFTVLTFACMAILALAFADPASAQLNNKKYTVDVFGSHINAPFDLIFTAVDCVEFITDSVVCFPLTLNDCGAYTITAEEGTTIHFEASLNFDIGNLIKGPVTIHGTVERDGSGSSLGFSFSGRLRSGDLGITQTRTNGSGHGLNGCDTMVAPTPLKPEERWVRDKD